MKCCYPILRHHIGKVVMAMLLFLLGISFLLNLCLTVLIFKDCKKIDNNVEKIEERCGE